MSIDWDKVIDELRRGWRQGEYGYDFDGSQPKYGVCLVGAIGCAMNAQEPNDAFEIADALCPIIEEQFPGRSTEHGKHPPHIPSFNDHEDTTVDDVILVCEKARANE